MDTRPIGILDSGSGGLTVQECIAALLPSESIIYVGDHANMPYGEKTKSMIRDRATTCIRFLLSRDVKLVVVACNAATVAGIDMYRNMFPNIPIIGVVPVVKTAATLSRTKRFAVLSTPSTARSVYQKHLIKMFAISCKVFSVGNSLLVKLVEEGKTDTPHIRRILKRILQPLLKEHIDVLVLGCTHFPFLKPVIEEIVGPDVMVLDSGQAVARHVKRILEHERITALGKNSMHSFFTSGDPENVSKVTSRLLGRPIVVERVASYVQ